MKFRFAALVLVIACVSFGALIVPVRGGVAIGGRCENSDVQKTLDVLQRNGSVRDAALVLLQRESGPRVFGGLFERALIARLRLHLIQIFWRRNAARVLCEGGGYSGTSKINIPGLAKQQIDEGMSRENAWEYAIVKSIERR